MRTFLTVVITSVILGAPLGCDEATTDDAKQSIEIGAEKTGKALEKGAEKTGEVLNKAAESTGDALKKVVDTGSRIDVDVKVTTSPSATTRPATTRPAATQP